MKRTDAIHIVGTGLITALGRNVAENLEAVNAGKTGIQLLDRPHAPVHFRYGAPSFDPILPDMPKKQSSQTKFLNRGALLGFHAALEAMAAVGFDHGVPPERCALFVASGDQSMVGCEFMLASVKEAMEGGDGKPDQVKLNMTAMNKVNPFFLLESLHNNLFSFLSAGLRFMGPNTSLASLSPGGGHALELAARSIVQGQADLAMAVGCGSWINEISLFELNGLGLLSSCRLGAASYRPLDNARDGFIPGEGGAAVLLMSEKAARSGRWGPSKAVLLGCGNCVETASSHSIRVSRDVTLRVMSSVLEASGMSPGDVGLVIPHGSGTRDGDRSELRSLMKLLGDSAHKVPVWALKSSTGHTGAASDLAEVILGIEAVGEARIPGALHFHETESEFAPLSISAAEQRLDHCTFLSVSYGIGGQSSALIVEVR